MNKHFESLIGAALYGLALAALFFVNPMRIHDPMSFTVIEVHALPIALLVIGLWASFGLLGAHPDMRAAHYALIVLACMVPVIVMGVQLHNRTWKLF
jgi:hypothetical protein